LKGKRGRKGWAELRSLDRTASSSPSLLAFSRSSQTTNSLTLFYLAMAFSDRRSSLIPVPILPRNVGSADLASQALDSPIKGRTSSPAPSSSSGLSPSPSNHHRPEHYAKLGLTRLPVSVVSKYFSRRFFRRTREGEREREAVLDVELTFRSFFLVFASLQARGELSRVRLTPSDTTIHYLIWTTCSKS